MLQPGVRDLRTLTHVTFLLKIKLFEQRHLFGSASIGCALSGYAGVLCMAHRKIHENIEHLFLQTKRGGR